MSVAEQEARFTQLVIAVIEESVTDEELSEFRSLLREHPEFKLQYLEQMRIHGLMHYHQKAAGKDQLRKVRFGRLARAMPALVRVAAMFAAVLAGVLLLRLAETSFLPPFTKSGAAAIAPVQTVRLSRPVGLKLPACLPGDLKLDSGEVTVRLESGVELTVLGPARLEVLDSMQVRLADGRLLAEVPPRATGFIVHAPGVSGWDLGTIFSAGTRNGTSDIFVFKGKVQVTDGEGDAVGLLEEGEGVRAMPESKPQLYVADGAEARKLFESVRREAAVASPVDALYAAGRIGDLWMARYMPKVASRATPGTNTAGARRAAQGPSVWFRPVENYSWGSGRNWLSGGALSRVPGRNDIVSLNSSRISTDAKAALLLGEKVDARCREFWMNDLGVSNNIHVRVDGGTLTCASLASVGASGPGLLTLAKGAFSVPLLKIGENEGGAGVVSNEHAALSVDTHLIVGRLPGAVGRLVLRGGRTRVGDQLIVGLHGQGLFEAEASFSVGRFVVGCMSKGTGTARIEAGATGTVRRVCFVGGRDYSPDDQGSGTLALRGGTLKLSHEGEAYENALQIRYAEACRGVLTGWGSVLATFTGDNPIRMVNNGCVIADGEGENRDLDLHSLASVTNSIPNGSGGTNGWYAVNRGRVLYPRTWVREPNATRNLGEWPSRAELGLVNSVRVTFGRATPSSFLCGGLCAPDRTDLPAALPEGRPAGVWHLGLYRDNSMSEQAFFETAAVTFRYDQMRVKASDVLTLYRYENGAWKVVGSGRPDGSGCLSAAAPLARANDGECNIGWFALVASDQAGLTITIR